VDASIAASKKYSVLRALRAIERADVVLLVVDATEGVAAQDQHVAGMILEAHKGVAVLVNKWDAVEKDEHSFSQWTRDVRESFHFIPYAPLLFISAKTGQRVEKLMELVLQINGERNTRVSTSKLNAILRDAVRDHPPASVHKGAHLRIFYATQAQVAPPVFLLFTNAPEEIHFSYKRYLENRIREEYPFIGVPIILVFKGREE
jgi:GTP-binding protein